MRNLLLALSVITVTFSLPPTCWSEDKPFKSTAPLSADAIAVYKAVLQQYARKEIETLNVSATTFPLDPASPMTGLSRDQCLQGIELDDLSTVSRYFHDLTPDVLPGNNMKLVDSDKQTKLIQKNDPAKPMRIGESVHSAVRSAFVTGLFAMSEIAFDKGHRYAAVRYSFWCGGLCGHGSTLILEKIDGRWKKTNRNCGGWIS